MGQHLIRISRWSYRSVFSAYSKLMTLIFALFCAATGQLPKNSSSERMIAAQTTFKGKILRSSDSTAIGGVTLFLKECFSPLYGIYPDYGVVQPLYGVQVAPLSKTSATQAAGDTIMTDDKGNFSVTMASTAGKNVSITSAPVSEGPGTSVYSSIGCITIIGGKDSTYTLYLKKLSTEVKQAASPQQQKLMTAQHGDILHITIPELLAANGGASIVNSRGQTLTSVTADVNGVFSWDTRTVAKGVYFFRARDAQTRFSARILVK